MTIPEHEPKPNAWTPEEIAAEAVMALPAKEVMSLLDLNANIDLALSAAAPIDLAIGANANVAAPIEAAVGANVLSAGSAAEAATLQAAQIHQGITGDATATATQHSGIAQGGSTGTATDGAAPSTAGTGPAPTEGGTAATPDTASAAPATQPADTSVATPSATTPASALDGGLLNVNVNLHGNLNLATPIDGAVAAQANVAAPIDAAVSGNIGSIDSQSVAVADQSAVIDQTITGNATATGDQTSTIDQ